MKVAIVGYGLEGKVNYDYYTRLGHEVTVVDEREELADLPAGVTTLLGSNAFSRLDDYDLIMRSPGVAPYKLETSAKIWSATNEFFEMCTTPIIGVTGSKGKGTTCSFITEILRASSKKVELVGNIGRPALEALAAANKADVVVYELSSFQLWDAERSPSTAVILHIEPDHLDVHVDLDDYLNAKANIARHMSADQMVVVHPTNLNSQAIAAQTQAKIIHYNSEQEGIAYVKDGAFYRGGQLLCDTDVVTLPGAHNLENACAAIAAVQEYEVSNDAIIKGLAAFTGLPHRLKFVREVDGIRYYDDSIATTPGSALAALRAFDAPKILILGGSSKGADYGELARAINATNVRRLILVGQEAQRLEDALSSTEVSYVRLGETTMQEIVNECHQSAESGDVVILSPAAASFDMFKSYSDRGDQFIAAVKEL